MIQQLKNFFHLGEAIAATIVFGFPGRKLTVVGVTGTDGKTTTSTLIHHILETAGYKTGISSTLSSAHTSTPGRWRVQKFLAQCVKNGCTHAVLEVTSIGIDQHRVSGTPFAVGVLTNIADNEHLDYHKSFAKYKAAKMKFLLSCKVVVANADDPVFAELKLQAKNSKVISFGLKNPADVDRKTLAYTTKLIGEFNTYNILGAIAATMALGVDSGIITRAISSFTPPLGRLEIVKKKPYTVVVDFAHTPQAFEKVLPVAKSLKLKVSNRLIHVFGATGDRDKSKRPIMATIAAKYDDNIILTHEDTYTEKRERIISEIEKGLIDKKYENYEKIFDRKSAIEKALLMASPGDVVLITGVGHQKSMNVDGKEIPWSDQKVVKEFQGK